MKTKYKLIGLLLIILLVLPVSFTWGQATGHGWTGFPETGQTRKGLVTDPVWHDLYNYQLARADSLEKIVKRLTSDHACISPSKLKRLKTYSDGLEKELEWYEKTNAIQIINAAAQQAIIDSLNNIMKMPYRVETFIDGSFDTTFLPKPCDCPKVFYVDTVGREMKFRIESLLVLSMTGDNIIEDTVWYIAPILDSIPVTDGEHQIERPE